MDDCNHLGLCECRSPARLRWKKCGLSEVERGLALAPECEAQRAAWRTQSRSKDSGGEMMSESKMTNLQHGEVEYEDATGKKTTYYPSRGVGLTVIKLMVCHYLDSERDPVAVSTFLRGTARLHDRSLSIIGESTTKTSELEITFSHKPRYEAAVSDVALERGEVVSAPLGGVSIGFSRSDWEIGTEDKWWAECYVDKNTIDELLRVVNNGKLSAMQLTVRCRDLYQDDHSMAPIAPRKNLFLRPSESESFDWPKIANGAIAYLNFSSASVDMSPPPEIAYEEPEPPQPPPEPPIDPVAESILKLTENLEKLRTSIKWIGFFVVVAVLIAANNK